MQTSYVNYLGFGLLSLILVLLIGYQWVVIEQIDNDDPRFTAANLGVVVNEGDRLSIEIADYYQTQRHIPQQNIITVRFNPDQTELSTTDFKALQRQVERQVSPNIQGFLLTWAAPYRVDCMSITSAFALGFDPKYCAQGCLPTAPNPYFNYPSSRPYHDYQVRPTMLLAATNFAEAKALIDRGLAAEGTNPKGTAYLLSTGDRARNSRATTFATIQQIFGKRFRVEVLQADTLTDKTDVMFYFTGLPKVDKLETLTFRPGAIADHLTSFGGKLTGKSGQMSSLRWLEAGATGSYGTVVEPCNFPQKFPDISIILDRYLNGATLLESYWQSVLWPGQGVFIGDPLARPFPNGDQIDDKITAQ
jgi:uncharacterized protein (TIGR03790 family)